MEKAVTWVGKRGKAKWGWREIRERNGEEMGSTVRWGKGKGSREMREEGKRSTCTRKRKQVEKMRITGTRWNTEGWREGCVDAPLSLSVCSPFPPAH